VIVVGSVDDGSGSESGDGDEIGDGIGGEGDMTGDGGVGDGSRRGVLDWCVGCGCPPPQKNNKIISPCG
jgi:hypothetical protein